MTGDTSSSAIAPDQMSPEQNYFLLTSLVVPRPIGWISTLDTEGRPNLAPFSYFNACSHLPPIVHFTATSIRAADGRNVAGREKDSLHNALSTGEFVANIVSKDLAERMVITSAGFGPDVNEFDEAGLEFSESLTVKPPRVSRAKAAMECRVVHSLQMGAGTVVFGEVQRFMISQDVLSNGRIDIERLAPVGRLGGSKYVFVDDIVDIRLPDHLPGGAPIPSSSSSIPDS